MTTQHGDDRSLDVYLSEHDALRAEQRQRIHTRDNILYFNIVAIGSAFSLGGKTQWEHILLVIPWIGLLLGWIHIINDIKISQIRDHLENVLFPNIAKLSGKQAAQGFRNQWDAHRRDSRKWRMKRFMQSMVQVVAFVLPGAVALVAFFFLNRKPPSQLIFWLMNALAILEGVLLLLLMFWLDRDFGWRRRQRRT